MTLLLIIACLLLIWIAMILLNLNTNVVKTFNRNSQQQEEIIKLLTAIRNKV